MKGKRQKGRGTTLRQYLRGEMKDPEFRRLYEEANIELRVALETTKAREARKMSGGTGSGLNLDSSQYEFLTPTVDRLRRAVVQPPR